MPTGVYERAPKTHCRHGHAYESDGYGHCRECGRKRAARYHIRHKERLNQKRREEALQKREMLNELKLDKGCEQCGYNKHPAALHFHHREDKVFNIGSSPTRSIKSLQAEIAKCSLLCANCHTELTWA